MTRRIVLATTHSGFALSAEAVEALRALGHADPESLPRDHVDLARVVERLGDRAGGLIGLDQTRPWGTARLRIATIPAEVEWLVEEYDGAEWVVMSPRWTEEGPIPCGESQPWRRRAEE